VDQSGVGRNLRLAQPNNCVDCMERRYAVAASGEKRAKSSGE